MISARFLRAFEGHLDLVAAAPHPARLHRHRPDHRGQPAGRLRRRPADGLYAHPTIVDGVRADDEIYRTETFGPIVGVATFDTFDEAVELANGHGYGLSAAIYTSDPVHAFRFRERVSAGMVSVNNSTSGAEAHLPFGGNGRSGNGSRQSGIWVLDQFTRWQSMNWDYAGKLQKAQMDTADLPPTPSPASGVRLARPSRRGQSGQAERHVRPSTRCATQRERTRGRRASARRVAGVSDCGVTGLARGENRPLPGEQVEIAVACASAVDVSALLLGADGRVRSDADFVFFNNPVGRGLAAPRAGPG